MRPRQRFAGLALYAAAVSSFVGFISNEPVAAGEVRALVPAYFYPTWWSGSPWDDLNSAASRIPVEAIMNPASGPGDSTNSDYQYAVGALHTAGGKVIGYVPTGYGSRAVADVLADVSSYIEWYGVDGVFLDEMGNQDGSLDYDSLYLGIKALAAGAPFHVVGNPGSPFDPAESLVTAADTLVIFEGPLQNADPAGASFKSYPKKGPYEGLPLWFKHYGGKHFANLVYGVPKPAKMLEAILKALDFHARYVFMTDDDLPNPYDTLPSYWDEEVLVIELLNCLE